MPRYLPDKHVLQKSGLCAIPNTQHTDCIMDNIYQCLDWNSNLHSSAPGVQDPRSFTYYDNTLVTFQILAMVSTKMGNFWVLEPCSPVGVYRRFRHSCCKFLPDHTAQRPRSDSSSNSQIFCFKNLTSISVQPLLYPRLQDCNKRFDKL